jgi:hypothetical protein
VVVVSFPVTLLRPAVMRQFIYTANIDILNNIVQLLYIFLYNSVYFFTLLETERNIHRGNLLDTAVRQSSTNISQMVKKLGISRGSFYNHIKDPNLSFETLARYGKAIKHDFSQDFPEMRKYVIEEPEVPYGMPKNMEEAIEQRDYWRERYYKKNEEFLRLLAGQRGDAGSR